MASGIYNIRDACHDDLPLVINSWVKAHASFTRADGCVIRYVNHPAVVLDLVQRCSVIVAYDPDDPSEVFGWLCHELIQGELVIHYAFIKQVFRRHGIANGLYDRVATGRAFTATHGGFTFAELRARYHFELNPFLLKEPK